MNKHDENDLIELGTASIDTKGTPFGMDDTQAGRYKWPGLSDD